MNFEREEKDRISHERAMAESNLRQQEEERLKILLAKLEEEKRLVAEAAAKAEREMIEAVSSEFLNEIYAKVSKIAAAEKVWLDEEKFK